MLLEVRFNYDRNRKEGKRYCHDASLKISDNCKGTVPMTSIFPTAPLRDLTRAYAAAIMGGAPSNS